MGTPTTAVSRATHPPRTPPPAARPRARFRFRPLTAFGALCVLCLLSAVGCAPEVGDECKTALDCSSQGSRVCDRTQPGGYCTIPNCEQGTCPDEAVCVLFRSDTPRLSSTYCMLKCSSNSDCRTGDGYECLGNATFGNGSGDALVLDGEGKRFCGFALQPGGDGKLWVADHSESDGGPMSVDDSGINDSGINDSGINDSGISDSGVTDAGDDADAGGR